MIIASAISTPDENALVPATVERGETTFTDRYLLLQRPTSLRAESEYADPVATHATATEAMLGRIEDAVADMHRKLKPEAAREIMPQWSDAARRALEQLGRRYDSTRLVEKATQERDRWANPHVLLRYPEGDEFAAEDRRSMEAETRQALRSMDRLEKMTLLRKAARRGDVVTLRAATMVPESFRIISEAEQVEVMGAAFEALKPEAAERVRELETAAFTISANASDAARQLRRILNDDSFMLDTIVINPNLFGD